MIDFDYADFDYAQSPNELDFILLYWLELKGN